MSDRTIRLGLRSPANPGRGFGRDGTTPPCKQRMTAMKSVSSHNELKGISPGLPTRPRPSRRWRPLLISALLLVGLLLVACGGSNPTGNGVATLAPGASSSSNGSPAPSASAAEPGEGMLAYSQCMRDNGVPDFPDPVNGGIQLDGDKVDMDSPAFKAAEQSCKSLLPVNPGDNPDDDQQARHDMLEFAACMREHGVPDFPDPKPGEGIDINGDLFDINSPAFKAAMEVCQTAPGGSPATNGGPSAGSQP